MDKLIIGIVIIFGAFWLLGVVLRVLSDFANAVGQEWERMRPGRERVGSAIGRPMGVLAATIEDHRLMSAGLAITLFVAALFLAGADSAWLVASVDALGGKGFPLLGWAIIGGVAGVAMGIASRIFELDLLDSRVISHVPGIGHLRAGEESSARNFRIRSFVAAVGAVILGSALVFSYSRNAGYDYRADADIRAAAIVAAGTAGNITILNAALNDSVGRLQSDPGIGLKTLLVLKGLSKEGVRPEVNRVAKIAQKYLEVFRAETEKLVGDGKPDALARSEAFLEVDRIASVKWLGRLYEAGWGGANKDLSKAFSFYGEAATAGDKTAAAMQDKLAHAMISAKDEGSRQEAFKYFEFRAQSGGPNDHYWFGQWYAGSSKPEDQKNAEKWLAKALSQDADATVKNLAFSSLAKLKDVDTAATKVLDERAPKYAKGKDENMKKVAYAYLELRANAGDPGSALWMGFRFQEGDGIAKDQKKAREWFLKAALQDKNKMIKDLAFEALGEKRTMQTKTVQDPEPNNDRTVRSAIPAKPESSTKTTESVRPADPTPASAVKDKALIAPPNSQIDGYGSGWVCKRGFRQVGNGCVPVQLPENAQIDGYGSGWVCKRGFRQVGNECVPVQLPENAQIDGYGSGWVCKRGFRQVGNECVPVQPPENAQIDGYGSGWVCKRGFRQVGNGCVPVQLPENAQIDGYGSGWVCKRGFRQVGNECVQILFVK